MRQPGSQELHWLDIVVLDAPSDPPPLRACADGGAAPELDLDQRRMHPADQCPTIS